jgi:hypothetical protein
VRKEFPRDKFFEKDEWSNDTTESYFRGRVQKVYLPLAKLAMVILWVLILSFKLKLNWGIVVISTLSILLSYQTIIAKIYGLIPMPPMDQQCFCSNKFIHVNYMSVSGYDGPVITEARHRQIWKEMVEKHPKFLYKVVYKFGDLYYEKMDFDTAFSRGYKFVT